MTESSRSKATDPYCDEGDASLDVPVTRSPSDPYCSNGTLVTPSTVDSVQPPTAVALNPVVDNGCCVECCPILAAQTAAPPPATGASTAAPAAAASQPLPSAPTHTPPPPAQSQRTTVLPIVTTGSTDVSTPPSLPPLSSFSEASPAPGADAQVPENADATSSIAGRKRRLSQVRTCEWAACAETFPTLDQLTPHLFKDHLNNNRKIDFHCRWGSCTVIVDGSDALLNHLTNHLGERLIYGCRWTNCGERFASFDELTGHLSEVHVGMGRGKYLCEWEECDRRGKVFTQRQKIMRHIQTHTGKPNKSFIIYCFSGCC